MKSFKTIGLFFLVAWVFVACEENESVEELNIASPENGAITEINSEELPSSALDFIYENFQGELVVSAFSFESLVGDLMYEAELTNAVNLRFDEQGDLLDFDDPEATCEGKRKKRGGKHHKGSKGDSTNFHTGTTSFAYEDLPESAQVYLETNYADANILKVKSKTDSAGLTIYKVLIAEIGAIVFDAEGEFIGISERGGRKCSTFEELALADLPEAIATYISENYPEGVVVKARSGVVADVAVYHVFIQDVGVLFFDADGNFIELHTCGNSA